MEAKVPDLISHRGAPRTKETQGCSLQEELLLLLPEVFPSPSSHKIDDQIGLG
jgi:hypothetical protein